MDSKRKFAEPNENSNDKLAVPYEESAKLAGSLVSKYYDQMHPEQDKVQIPYRERAFQHPIDFLKQVPEEVLNQYMAHGNKHEFSDVGPLADTLNILSNSKIKGGYWAPLSGRKGGQGDIAFITEIMVILDKNNPVPEKNDRVMLNGSWYYSVNLQAAIFGERFYPLLPEIQAIFPKVKILRADQIPEYFKQSAEVDR